jgi:hypothetical protein
MYDNMGDKMSFCPFGSNNGCTQYLCHIDILKEYLALHFKREMSEVPRLSMDFVVMSFLMGTDFCPALSPFTDPGKTFSQLLSVYRGLYYQGIQGFLMNGNEINTEFMRSLLEVMRGKIPNREGDGRLQDAGREQSAHEYLKGVLWTSLYYTNGCVEWDWSWRERGCPDLEVIVQNLDDFRQPESEGARHAERLREFTCANGGRWTKAGALHLNLAQYGRPALPTLFAARRRPEFQNWLLKIDLWPREMEVVCGLRVLVGYPCFVIGEIESIEENLEFYETYCHKNGINRDGEKRIAVVRVPRGQQTRLVRFPVKLVKPFDGSLGREALDLLRDRMVEESE